MSMNMTETFILRRMAVGVRDGESTEALALMEHVPVYLRQDINGCVSWSSDKKRAEEFNTLEEAIAMGGRVREISDEKWVFDLRYGTEILRRRAETIVREETVEVLELGVKIP